MYTLDPMSMAARLGALALVLSMNAMACGKGSKDPAAGDAPEQAPARPAGEPADDPTDGPTDGIAPEDLVQAHLLAGVTRIAPGQTFVLAARFDIAPGWHIYWENPGESGLSTDLEPSLPAGFEAGPVRYPGPVRFDSPGPVTSYGYAGQVLLSAEVRAPDALSEASYELSAQASWLACKAACVRGRAKIALDLPVATTAEPPAPANQALLEQHAARLPRPWSALSGARHAWADGSAPALTLSVPGAARLWFFPATDNQLGLVRQEAGTGAGAASLRLVYKEAWPAAGAPARAHGVLGVARDGATTFHSIDIPRPGPGAR